MGEREKQIDGIQNKPVIDSARAIIRIVEYSRLETKIYKSIVSTGKNWATEDRLILRMILAWVNCEQ